MTPSPDRKSHDSTQSAYFDQRVNIFCRPIPEEIQERTKKIVESARLNKNCSVLDVGCGTGVLFSHFIESGVRQQNITGCDLSAQMIQSAKERYPNAKYYLGDIIDFPANLPHFNAVFFNACFGNIFNQKAALEKAVALLKPAGLIIISHPLGAKFVKSLHESEPHIVPHLLPSKEALLLMCAELQTKLSYFEDSENYYLAHITT